MNKRILPVVGALVVVVALVALALVAGRDGGDEPRVLPVLSASGKVAASEAATRSGAAEDASYLSIAGYSVYELPDDLPALPDEAPAYELDDEVDQDDVRELADVLGIDAEVRTTEWGWSVGDGHHQVDVYAGSGSSWSYFSAPEGEQLDVGHDDEQQVDVHVEEPDTAVSSDEVLPEGEVEEVEAPSASIDKDAAERVGRAKLEALGVDLEDAEVSVQDGWTSWIVTADPRIGGLPTLGFSTSVSVGADDRIEFANGWLSPAEVIADYPLDDVREVVARTLEQEKRWAEDASGGHPVETWTYEVTRVRLGLAMSSSYEEGAPAYLVPSYLLRTDEDWEVSLFAVTDDLLAPAPASADEGEGEGEDDHGHEDDEPAGTRAETCTAQGTATETGGAEPDVRELQLCGPSRVAVGEPVELVLTASGLVRDDCASPRIAWGDGSDQPICEIGCVALPTEPTEVERTFEHTYDEPGTYVAEVVLAGCPDGVAASISLEVVVEA